MVDVATLGTNNILRSEQFLGRCLYDIRLRKLIFFDWVFDPKLHDNTHSIRCLPVTVTNQLCFHRVSNASS